MSACPGTRERPTFLGAVRQRIIISLLAVLLALTDYSVWPAPAPSAMHGDYSTIVVIAETRLHLACEGEGPATVAILSPSAVGAVIDHEVRERLSRSVRICLFSRTEAALTAAENLAGLLPATLAALHAAAPYVIISSVSMTAAFVPANDPANELVAGHVLIAPLPLPPTGMIVHANGTIAPLPIGDAGKTTLAILSLLWPAGT